MSDDGPKDPVQMNYLFPVVDMGSEGCVGVCLFCIIS